MSVRKLSRQRGIVMSCNGVEGNGETRLNCKSKLQTGQIEARGIRAYARTVSWGRGMRKGRKRCDLCPECLPIERDLFKEAKKRTEEWKAERNERRKAKWAEKKAEKEAEAASKPKKPRKKSNATSSPTTFSPSEASAPAPPT